jgi:hypothetical protein
LLVAQRGATAEVIAFVSGNTLPANAAQASPAAIASIIGRRSRADPKGSVETIDVMTLFSRQLHRSSKAVP